MDYWRELVGHCEAQANYERAKMQLAAIGMPKPYIDRCVEIGRALGVRNLQPTTVALVEFLEESLRQFCIDPPSCLSHIRDYADEKAGISRMPMELEATVFVETKRDYIDIAWFEQRGEEMPQEKPKKNRMAFLDGIYRRKH